MDARINPAAAFGLKEGDAHVIRNAGGRASDDAVRSLIISHKLLGTKEWFVVHHTGEFFSRELCKRVRVRRACDFALALKND
jgi:carbonic anhydrase